MIGAAILRRVATVVVVALFGAGLYFGIKARYGSYEDFYYVTTDVPQAGQLMRVGADVREQGVLVGTVSDIQLVDRHARLTLQIDPQYRIPSQAEAFINLKTLLGDKFVDIRFESYAPPFVRDGDSIPGHVGPELEDVLQSGVTVFEAIDPIDAATVVGELAQGARGHGDDVARGLQANAELSTLFAETLEPQLRGLHAFHVVFGELKDRGIDLNNLADAVNEGVPVYASEKAHRYLRRVLTVLVPMTDHLADLLIFNRKDLDRMIDSGDLVLETVAQRPEGLRDLVHGLYRYVFKLGAKPYPLRDGSGAAPFANFFGGDDFSSTVQNICGALPAPILGQIPLCREIQR